LSDLRRKFSSSMPAEQIEKEVRSLECGLISLHQRETAKYDSALLQLPRAQQAMQVLIKRAQAGELVGAVRNDSGDMIKLPPMTWNRPDIAEQFHRCSLSGTVEQTTIVDGPLLLTHRKSIPVHGDIFVCEDSLEALLEGSPLAPTSGEERAYSPALDANSHSVSKARRNARAKQDELEREIEKLKAQAANGVRGDRLAQFGIPSTQSIGIDEPTSSSTAQRHPKTSPDRGRAAEALRRLHPDGVPSQSERPNKVLIGEVCDWLKDNGKLPVKPDTILRAAGRRA
jgi:hypothetical protein